ncbi:hypothetical protein J6590_002042 [Homalodisca vitripennis]|nr:hypothetical protein J6590_002042 [Homalodisca vitripennis]
MTKNPNYFRIKPLPRSTERIVVLLQPRLSLSIINYWAQSRPPPLSFIGIIARGEAKKSKSKLSILGVPVRMSSSSGIVLFRSVLPICSHAPTKYSPLVCDRAGPFQVQSNVTEAAHTENISHASIPETRM